MITNGDEFIDALVDALNHLYDLNRLKSSPLINMLGMSGNFNPPSLLQQSLLDNIRNLQPPPGETAGSIHRRNHDILSLRFEQQYSQKEIARQLGLSVRQCRRAQTAAVGALAARIWNRNKLSVKVERESLQKEATAEKISEQSQPYSLPPELAWLHDLSKDESADLVEVFAAVLKLVEALASRLNVAVSLRSPEKLPHLLIHPVTLRHILLDILNIAILNAGLPSIEAVTRMTPEGTGLTIPVSRGANHPFIQFPNLEMTRKLASICDGQLVFNQGDGVWTADLVFPAVEQLPVLVVDDIEDTLHLFQRYVTHSRYRIIATRSPRQVPDLIAAYQPRVLVMDIMMPEIDGWDLLTSLRANPLTHDLPVLVCTVLNLRELAYALGANDFLQKPVQRDDFLSALDRQVILLQKGPALPPGWIPVVPDL